MDARRGPKKEPPENPQSLVARGRRFLEEATSGLDKQGVRRLFDEEATEAFRTLAGRRDGDALPSAGLERFLIDVRDVFLGFVLKLSPSRRLLFTCSLASAGLGTADLDIRLQTGNVTIDSSPFWFLVSVCGLTLLLALELVDRLRVRDELEVARGLQRDLLPQELPPMPGYRVAHSYRTANEIGGDYYDFVPVGEHHLAIAVGDASGHGMAAGLLMAVVNATFEATLDVDPEPPAVFEVLNRTLLRAGGRRAFMTLFYGLLDLRSGEMTYAVAGHPHPIFRRLNGRLEEDQDGSLPLGLWATQSWEARTTTLLPGDLMLLYTDGIPEAVGPTGDFGFERIRTLTREPGTARSVHDRVLRAVEDHLDGEPLRDDLTLVVVDRLPPLPPA